MWRASPSRRASAADSSISRVVTENGEQGATAIWTRSPSASPASRSVSARTSSISSTRLSGGRPPSETPRSIEPREATRRTPSSRAARISASTRPGDAAREDVVVVEDGRAARERELGEAGARGGVEHLLVDPRPDRVERPQPREEVGVLRAGARERLVEVVVRVDEARGDDRAAQVLGRAGRVPAADLGDEAVLDPEPAAVVLGARLVHRDDRRAGVGDRGGRRRHVSRTVQFAPVEVLSPRSLAEALELKAEQPGRAADPGWHRRDGRAELRPAAARDGAQPERGRRAARLVARRAARCGSGRR